jgi:antirestriction protein ArdC
MVQVRIDREGTEMAVSANELFEQITARVIADIEAGPGTWQRPWQVIGGSAPISAKGRAYRGINHLWLSIVGADKGYNSGVWGTYNQWSDLGCQVRKGQSAKNGQGPTDVILWKQSERKQDDGTTKKSFFATTFKVFAAEQVEGSEAVVEKLRPSVKVETLAERVEGAEAFFEAVGADVRNGGDRAFFNPASDYIQIPDIERFVDAESYYATEAHEHIHWTGHEDRLARTFGTRFGDEAYAVEELVAELGAAFLSSHLGLAVADEIRPDHSQYIAHWLKVLKADSKALQTVASRAQAAADYLIGKSAGIPQDVKVEVAA